MKDRVPVNPGRVLITPENGAAAFYATMTRADNPTQEGDQLNKNTLLKDATAALYGLPNTAVPDDVFALIKQAINSLIENSKNAAKIATGSYTGTGKCGQANPNSLTFDFAPKIVIVIQDKDSILPGSGVWNGYAFIWTYGMGYTYLKSSNGQNTFNLSGNTLSWYQTYDTSTYVKYQLNTSGTTYNYVAIG